MNRVRTQENEREYLYKSVLLFSVDFTPDPAFMAKLPQVAEIATRDFKVGHWQIKPDSYSFRDENQQIAIFATHKSLSCMAIGLEVWNQNASSFDSFFRQSIQKFAPKSLIRAGFKSVTWHNLEMSTIEICQLFHGSFLSPREDFPAEYGDINDCLIHLEGNLSDAKYVLVATPQKPEVVRRHIATLLPTQLFSKNSFDDMPARLLERYAIESLMTDVDVFIESPDADMAFGLLKKATDIANSLVDTTVRHLKSLTGR